jgi:hypothetical protein
VGTPFDFHDLVSSIGTSVLEDEIGSALDDQVADSDAQRDDRQAVFKRQGRHVRRSRFGHVIERANDREALMNFAHALKVAHL